MWSADPEALMATVKCDAEPSDMLKAFRGNRTCLRLQQAVQANMDSVVEAFCGLLFDVIKITPRPTAKLFQQSACMAWPETNLDEARLWGQRLAASVSYCRNKFHGSTSGAKLSPAVYKIGRLLSEIAQQDATMGQKLMAKARKLQREHSSPKLPVKSPSSSSSLQTGKAVVQEPPSKADKVKAAQCAIAKQPEAQQLVVAKPVPKDYKDTPMASSASSVCSLFGFSEKYVASAGVTDVDDGDIIISSQNSSSSSSSNSEEPAATSSIVPFKQYMDSAMKTLVRVFADGSKVAATTRAGPAGFLLARFSEEAEIVTEIPNIIAVMPVMKKPAASNRASKKRAREESEIEAEASDAQADEAEGEPAEDHGDASAQEKEDPSSSSSEEEQEQQELVQPVAKGPPKDLYGMMYYQQPRSAYAVRQKFGSKKQVFQLRHKIMKKEDCLRITIESIAKLNAGMSEEAVKQWATQQCS
jgi:hypothetical protein